MMLTLDSRGFILMTSEKTLNIKLLKKLKRK